MFNTIRPHISLITIIFYTIARKLNEYFKDHHVSSLFILGEH